MTGVVPSKSKLKILEERLFGNKHSTRAVAKEASYYYFGGLIPDPTLLDLGRKTYKY